MKMRWPFGGLSENAGRCVSTRLSMAIEYMIVFFALAAVAAWAPLAEAQSSYYPARCAPCHSAAAVATCNGCHAHGVHSSSAKNNINVTARTNKTNYAPGETVQVAVTGGYRTGWIRVVLYDHNGVEVARSTGPTGMGGGAGYTATSPINISGTAPTTPGTYTWRAAWYGNQDDAGGAAFGAAVTGWVPDPGNPNHGEERVSTNSFTVSGPVLDTTPPLVASVNPPDAQTDVPANAVISVTFSEAVVAPAASITLSAGTANVPGTITVSGATAAFTPSVILSDDTAYTVRVTTAVTDLAGNPLPAEFGSTFTTSAPLTAPAVAPGSAGGGGGGGCAVAGRTGSGGGPMEAAGAYGFLVLAAMGIAFRSRIRRKKE